MMELTSADWSFSPSVQLISIITNTDCDKVNHGHKFFEIFYVLEGTITHVYNDKKEILNAGDMRLLRPTDNHNFIRKHGETCSHRDIIITSPLFKKCCDFIDPFFFNEIISSSMPLRAKLSPLNVVEFEKEFSKKIFDPNESDTQHQLAITNILTIKLLSLFFQTEQPVYQDLPAWLKKILPSFSSPVFMQKGLPQILNDLQYDKSYLCRSFKKYMGCTMSEYLQERRLNYALSLLLATEKTVEQICEEIGFRSSTRFTVMFKNKYSLPPKQFKKKFFS